jgi:hypothetical protein
MIIYSGTAGSHAISDEHKQGTTFVLFAFLAVKEDLYLVEDEA